MQDQDIPRQAQGEDPSALILSSPTLPGAGRRERLAEGQPSALASTRREGEPAGADLVLVAPPGTIRFPDDGVCDCEGWAKWLRQLLPECMEPHRGLCQVCAICGCHRGRCGHQGGGPGHYLECVDKGSIPIHTPSLDKTSTASDELGLQIGIGVAPQRYVGERGGDEGDDGDRPWPDPAEGQFDLLAPNCPEWATFGECEAGHFYAKAIYCGREWCPSTGCGGKDGHMHKRRIARWLPKGQRFREMGYWVLTIPQKLRPQYRSQEALGKLGTAARRMMQRHGFKRGLRRWHLFGDGCGKYHDQLDLAAAGELQDAPPFHPHLNILVESGRVPKEKIEAVRASWRNILGLAPGAPCVIFYGYAKTPGKMMHKLSYVTRPTFLRYQWDEDLAVGLLGWHNASTWGKWKKKNERGEEEWLEPVEWEMGEKAPVTAELVALEAGTCPLDGKAIKWSHIVPLRWLKEGWENLGGAGGGYLRWSGSGPPPAKVRAPWLRWNDNGWVSFVDPATGEKNETTVAERIVSKRITNDWHHWRWQGGGRHSLAWAAAYSQQRRQAKRRARAGVGLVPVPPCAAEELSGMPLAGGGAHA